MTTTPQTESQRLADEALVEFQCGALSVLTGRKMIAELRRLDSENSDLRERNAALGNAQEIALDTATEHALRADELRGALATAEAERDQLREAIKKQANAAELSRKNAFEMARGLVAEDIRCEGERAKDEAKSVAEANAILTAENDQLRAQVERLQATEPFGYFRVDALGWTDCAATDEGAIALYERPAAPAVPQGEPVAWMFTDPPMMGSRTEFRTDPENVTPYWTPLYTAQPAAPALVPWQPIATAPKDGTKILAYIHIDDGDIGVMKWMDFCRGLAVWVWADELMGDVDPDPYQPTHWMPLPPAPVGIGQDGVDVKA